MAKKINITSDIFERFIRRAYEAGAVDGYAYYKRGGEEPVTSEKYKEIYGEIVDELFETEVAVPMSQLPKDKQSKTNDYET